MRALRDAFWVIKEQELVGASLFWSWFFSNFLSAFYSKCKNLTYSESSELQHGYWFYLHLCMFLDLPVGWQKPVCSVQCAGVLVCSVPVACWVTKELLLLQKTFPWDSWAVMISLTLPFIITRASPWGQVIFWHTQLCSLRKLCCYWKTFHFSSSLKFPAQFLAHLFMGNKSLKHY